MILTAAQRRDPRVIELKARLLEYLLSLSNNPNLTGGQNEKAFPNGGE